jgi:hypothetical protein
MSIPIPDSVSIKRNKKSEVLLLDKSRKWLERQERTEGIHASDILNPRKAFFQRMFPGPLEDRQVTIFLIGKVLHGFVLGTMQDKVDLNVTDEGSSFSEDLGLWYSPDWDKGEIAEFKTSRSFKEPTGLDDVSSYVQQLLIYMAAKNRLDAELWVLYLNLKDEQRRTEPQFRAYRISITEGDLELVRHHIKSTRSALETALETKDHTPLELCWEFLCSERMCPFWHKCQPEGRYEGAATQ